MEPLFSAFWAAFLRIRKIAQLHTLENMPSLVLGDETYCEDLKAPGLGDVQDDGFGNDGFGEESLKQRGRGPDFHLLRIPRLSEDGSLVILHGPIPFEGPGCV